MLVHDDLARWREWQSRREPLHRHLTHALLRPRDDGALSYRSWGDPGSAEVVVAFESLSPSERAALLAPMRVLRERGLRVTALARTTTAALLPHPDAEVGPLSAADVVSQLRSRVRAVLSLGSYMQAGAVGHALAGAAGVPFVAVQHGLVTPLAPPLSPGTRLLAWSAADGTFWANGDPSVEVSVVGSELLADATRRAAARPPASSDSGPVVFLGQLHGLELPRRCTRATVAALRRRGPVEYRPHPAEVDVLSRWQHRRWEGQGVAVLPSAQLEGVEGPVVSHFSTGILEAAALGVPSYAWCAEPPDWLRELWRRYDMSVWGHDGEPTSVKVSRLDPAEAIADVVEGLAR